MTYAACTSYPTSDSRATLDIIGFAIRSLSSFLQRPNLSCGSRSKSWRVLMSHPRTIISLLGVPSSNNLFSESVFFLGTGLSKDRGLIDTCIASGTDAAFLFIMSKRFKHNCIISFRKQSPYLMTLWLLLLPTLLHVQWGCLGPHTMLVVPWVVLD